MSVYITTSEAAYYEGISERGIRKRIEKGLYQSRVDVDGAVKRHLVLLDSLSEKARQEYFREHLAQKKLKEPVVPVATDEQDVLGKLVRKYGNRGKELLEQITFRESIAKMVISIRASKEKGKTARINELAKSIGQSPATIRRWADRYIEYGQDGLIHNKVLESLFTPKTYRSFHPLAQDYLRVVYLDLSKPTVEDAYEALLKIAKEKGWKVGSYHTAWRIIQDIPEEDLIYFREGRKAWEQLCMPRALREDPEYLNEVFEIDHTQMNFFINVGGKPVRPWLTYVVEVKSRCVVGWCISLQANAETIGLALRHAILPKPDSPIYGLPKYVIIDNGQDFRSRRIAGKNPNFGEEIHAPHLLGLFGRLEIMPRYCRAYNGAGKGRVERSFRTTTEQFYRDYIGWCGANPKERPENLNEKKLCEEGKLVDFYQCVEDFKAFVDAYNREARDMFGGKSSLDVYMESKRWKEEVPSERLFDMWLLPGEARKVHNIGVRFQNRVYENVQALSGHVREEISILYDPNDLSQIYAFTMDGEYIGTLPLKEHRAYITEDEDTFKHVAKQKARRTEVRKRVDEMVDRLKEEGVTKPRKMMASGDNGGKPKVVMIHRDERVAKDREAARQAKPATKAKSLHDEYVQRRSEEALRKMKLS